MSDNFPLTPGSGRNAATDQVTYSGDTADVQLMRLVQTTGSEGSKTVVDLPGDASNGLDVDVTRLPALVAGTAIIGKAGIDQTTPGTTDSVTVKSKTIYQKQLFGSAVTVINTAVDIAAGNFGVNTTTFTNNDAAVPGAPYAMAMMEAPDWAAAPVAGTTVDLYGVIKDVDGTDDETDAPSGTAAGGARYFGSWVIAAADALQRRSIPISLLGISESMSVDFYTRNGTGQNMNNDGGTAHVVKITPFTIASVG